jgi:hypothetical protein
MADLMSSIPEPSKKKCRNCGSPATTSSMTDRVFHQEINGLSRFEIHFSLFQAEIGASCLRCLGNVVCCRVTLC